MKISNIAIVLLAVSSIGLQAQTPTTAPSQGNLPAPTDYQIVQQDGNSRVWQREIYEQAPNGQIVARPHQFTELATGLNFKDSSGQWQPSKEEIDLQPDGTMCATQGQHQVYFPSDIYNGVIEMVTPDGEHLKSQPTALSYDDASNTVLIAVLTNSIGQLVGSNQVIYPNAFVGLDADLLFSYTKSGLEQDVVLRERPPTPASLGLNPDTTRLQVLTEFFDPPQPSQTTSTLPEQAGLALTDDTLDFGTMQMVPGKAFKLGEDSTSARVGKSWVTLQGRQFLVEAVPVAALAEQLDGLPAPSAQTASTAKARMISRNLVLPPQHLAKAGVQSLKLARTGISRKPGVVLDYLTVNSSLTNYTFQGDTTYFINGAVYLYGTNTFEGGSVLKYAMNSQVNIGTFGTASGINCLASAYRPVIFTAKDDNSVGDTISGSTGNPTNYYANPALNFNLASAFTISYFRIAWAAEAIGNYGYEGSQLNYYHGQLVNCQNGISWQYGEASLRNTLFANVQTNFNVNYATAYAQNATFSGSSCLAISSYGGAVILTNCILANVAHLTSSAGNPPSVSGGYNGFYNCPEFGSGAVTNNFYPFQTVGGGEYYLTNGCSFHNAGTTNIDPVLLANLAAKTTYPPIAYTNVTFSTATTFSPQAQRDYTGAPDLGYHYDPIDYSFGGCFADANLTFTNGTAVGWFRTSSGWAYAGYGIDMGAGVTVLFSGTATAPDYWVRLNTVQEQDYTAGYGQAGIETWVNSDLPTVSGQFLRCSAMAGELRSYFSDDYGSIQARMVNCEFWGGTLDAYGDYMYFTNCLMQRVDMELWNGGAGDARITWDCTFFGGEYDIERTSGGSAYVSVRNSSFDGTSISTSDYYGSNPTYSDYNYNAYTNSADPFSIGGANDVTGVNFNWQSSWFGNYYLPTNSPLINVGSTTANLLGLYHFTTQTNQTIEGNSTVDIGYHYVATDQYGNPLDSNGDGIPDYLEDPLGNGLPYDGTNWALAVLTEPISQTVNQGDNVTISVSAGGVAPLAYQWYFGSGVVANATNAALILDNVQTNSAGNYSVVVTNNFGSITSSVAALTVMPPPTITITNPISNALIVASVTNVTLAAVVSNVVSSITQVQFFQNQTNIGIVTSVPYTLVWSNALAGSYALTAVATDNRGLSVTSSVVNLIISPLFASNTMCLWLKADAITNLTNNASVATWYDQSGHTNNATQTTSGDQPLYITNAVNGMPAVWFNGTNDYLKLPNLLNGTTGAEAFVVVKATTNAPSGNRPLWQFGTSNNGGGGGYPRTDGSIADDFGSSVLQAEGIPTQLIAQYNVYEVSAQTNSFTAWINGVRQCQTNGNVYAFDTAPTLGCYTYSYLIYYPYGPVYDLTYFSGNIAEVMVFNQPLTSGERATVNGYLNGKYGLVPAVPATPTNLVATAISTNQISLTWDEVFNAGATQIAVERSTASNGTYQVVAQLSSADSYVDTNLASNTTYYYKVQAINLSQWSGYSDIAQATTGTIEVSLPFDSLIMWLKADVGLFQGETNIPVSLWPDQSGNENDASQLNAVNEPVWVPGSVDGWPAVRFNGTNNYLQLQNLLNGTTGAEAFVVVKATTNTPSANRPLWQFGASNNNGNGYPTTGGSIADDFGSGAMQVEGIPAQSLTQYHVYEVSAQTNSFTAWINGIMQYQTNVNAYAFNTAPTLGLYTYSSWDYYTESPSYSYTYFAGDIAEVLVFNRPLTLDEQDTVGTYLMSKYGLYQYATNAVPPMAPTNLISSGLAPYQLNLQWTSTSSNISSLHLERELGTNGDYVEVSPGGLEPSLTNFVDTTASPTNEYYYRVHAHNYFGDAYSAAISPPTVALTNDWPAYVLQYSTNLIQVGAGDLNGTISSVQFMANNGMYATNTTAPYAAWWTPTTEGPCSLSALATDSLGNSQFSAGITLISYLDSNGDGIPDAFQVQSGNNPLNPWTPPTGDTNNTPPSIILVTPANATLQP